MKIILTGASGRMGKQVLALFQSKTDVDVIAVDSRFQNEISRCGILQYRKISEVEDKADAIVDFSLHTATQEVIEFAVANNVPLVVATTGHTAQERALIVQASRRIPVFFASNMSVAIAYLKCFAAKLAKVFPDADVEIIEAHHSKKIDSPSGTALSAAKKIVDERGFGQIVVGRGEQKKKGDVNVHSLRIGESLGEHEVIIDTGRERIVLQHRTFSGTVYAEGAWQAVNFIANRKNGLYGIEDMINA